MDQVTTPPPPPETRSQHLPLPPVLYAGGRYASYWNAFLLLVMIPYYAHEISRAPFLFVKRQNLPEKGDLWRDVLAASEITTATDPVGALTLLDSVFIRNCIVTTAYKYW